MCWNREGWKSGDSNRGCHSIASVTCKPIDMDLSLKMTTLRRIYYQALLAFANSQTMRTPKTIIHVIQYHNKPMEIVKMEKMEPRTKCVGTNKHGPMDKTL